MKLLKMYLLALTLVVGLTTQANVPSRLIKDRNGVIRLFVHDKPFVMLAGELHNSSNSTPDYLNSLWPSLKALNLNTVLAAVAWEQIEPNEGVYDFTLVDNLIDGARRNDLKVVVLWFGSWKNGESSYAPEWVKRDTKRFVRVRRADGQEIETLSPFCRETCKADGKAYAALMKHIKDIDETQGTVIAIQPQNEVGMFQDMGYCSLAQDAYKEQVPSRLFCYMRKNQKTLRPELKNAWIRNGKKTSGTWAEVFGDDQWGKTFYTTWEYADYINEIAAVGKAIYPIPTFCNCWLVQNSQEKPGDYPNGGPVSRVFDIWKAAAPNVDVLCPDIYLPQFKEIAADYHRHDNPLLIPESTLDPGRAFWAFGEHGALCYSPFGIEDGAGNYEFAQAYKVLGELMPYITKYQNTDRMIGIMNDGKEKKRQVKMGDYLVTIHYESPSAYGMIIQTADDEFLVAGMNFKVTFASANARKTGYIRQVWEGGFADNDEWIPSRLLNGDETYHNAALIAKGRKKTTSELVNNYSAQHNEDQGEIFAYSPESFKAVWSPGIYRVYTYLR